MPRYQITEYRHIHLYGLSASASSIIHAKDISDARIKATLFNNPKGEWKETDGTHYIGDKNTNMSIVMPLPHDFSWIKDKETREYCEKYFVNNKTLNMIREGKVLRTFDTGNKYPKPKMGLTMLHDLERNYTYNLIYHPINTLNPYPKEIKG